MNQVEERQRRALLLRQAGMVLREEAKGRDKAARRIDGSMSEEEKQEIAVILEIMRLKIEKAALEYRLALPHERPA